eukprot:TRINITY_DN5854_c0_g1_i3.p1 TRINITY_DN5854_c0_g1~~TRINITY_DN5854_c0_g1_i3.p1  ORF type:complete len:121 (+),score=31.85 TRINITY_DN5854_c0_g1_i3:49-363(+)
MCIRDRNIIEERKIDANNDKNWKQILKTPQAFQRERAQKRTKVQWVEKRSDSGSQEKYDDQSYDQYRTRTEHSPGDSRRNNKGNFAARNPIRKGGFKVEYQPKK